MVERPAVNRRVVGSNPTRGAIRLARLPAGSLMISEHSPSFPLREETQNEHCAVGSADSAGRPVCHRGPVEDWGTWTDARKNDARFFAGPDSPGRSWGDIGGIRPGASGGRGQVGGSRGGGRRNPCGRGGWGFLLAPSARGGL